MRSASLIAESAEAENLVVRKIVLSGGAAVVNKGREEHRRAVVDGGSVVAEVERRGGFAALRLTGPIYPGTSISVRGLDDHFPVVESRLPNALVVENDVADGIYVLRVRNTGSDVVRLRSDEIVVCRP